MYVCPHWVAGSSRAAAFAKTLAQCLVHGRPWDMPGEWQSSSSTVEEACSSTEEHKFVMLLAVCFLIAILA